MPDLLNRAGGMGEIAEVQGPYETAPFGNELVELAKTNQSIVGLSADMSKYSDIVPFMKAYPERYFNAGVAEQSAVMMAAGLAKVGKTAFCATYAAFLSRRALDFIAIACAHSKANVKIVAGSPGLVNPYGATHQSLEDLVVMRSVPDLTVIDPCDAVELRHAVRAAAATPGTFYIRNLRGKVPVVFDESDFEFVVGKARRVREGTDVAVISTGFMTERAMKASDTARDLGVSAAVLHVPTIKPLDEQAIVDIASSVGRVVVVENGLRAGGLGTAVIEVVHDRGIAVPVTRIGLHDRFHPCGSQAYNEKVFGLDQDAITDAVVTGNWAFA
ncbi:transketolase family protein [Rhodococcus sp. BP-252]|uniref:transketolase family protein n=1 Tax=unclassified Rhodococcus (in: high G+C Gram-positive bacteria) TaxID=192944 RepID=UPI001C9A336E|nr:MULTISPECIES: transketolase C-terminal domain-containing protein [unclassified Rhodococcus (in: high G+C Gram-positive bacteria)]MBY6414634.1 transketolase family protein [Rhodococcus sp. BP-320]MBY6419391.1 transketolase family protein [Rhodococcus sp. BP-321]MBY6424437.1 transketolase family protein [Rhodococcus sp. BP-324]MBY6429470.1 transketolase family protein [Rhodococcus sp. BP-323]MBY6434446.1 transketolase family protein [Rhodococcus sp. BP-322]